MNQDIAVRGPGGLADPGGQGSEDIVTYAKWVVESGLFGRGITQAQAGLKMLVGRELGIPPLAAVRNVYIFEAQGRPVVILDATLMGAMVRTSGRYDYEVEQHDDEATVLAMYRVAKGPNRIVGREVVGGEPLRTFLGRESFSQQDAVKRKLANKPGPWNEGYAKEMRFARCLSHLVDHYAPELLLGLSVPVVTQDDADEMPMGHDQRKAIFAGLKPYEMTDGERHDWASDIIGRRVDSFAEGQPSCPTRREASMLLAWLDEQPEPVTVLAPDEGTVTAGESPEDSNKEGGMPADIGPDWSEDPERGADVPVGAGVPKPGEVKAPAPAAPQVTNLVAEQSTLDVLMTELEAVRGKRSAKVVDAWLSSWLTNEKLIGIEHADEEQAERGLSWLRAQFGARR